MAVLAPAIVVALTPALGATAAAIGAGIATSVLSAGLSFGLNALLAKKPKQRQSDIAQEFQFTAGGVRVHYGARFVGPAAWLFLGHDGAGKLYKLVVFGSDGVSAVNNIYLSGEIVTLDEAGFVTDDKFRSSKIGSHAQIITTLGADDQAVIPELNAAFPDEWTANHRARGHALMLGIFERAKGEQINSMYPGGRAPEFGLSINGKPVLDLRDDTTGFSENPVLQLYDYLQTKHGGGFVPSEFDAAEWRAAADDCDEVIALKAGGTEARYRCAYTVVETEERSVIVSQFLAAMAGQIRERPDGTIGIRSGKWRAPTVTINEADIISIESADGDDARKSYSKRVSTFLDPNARFTETTTTPFVNSTLLARVGDLTEASERQQVPSASQCARLDKIQIAFDNPDRQVILTLREIGALLEDEENSYLNVPDRAFNNAPMWIDNYEETEAGDFVVVLRSASATSFDWDAATEEPSPPLSFTLPGQTGGIPDMAGLAVTVGTGMLNGQNVPKIIATWTNETSYEAVCQISPASDDDWENMNVQTSGNRAAINILDESVDYDVRCFWSLDPTRTTAPDQPGTGAEQQIDDIEVVASNTPPAAPAIVSQSTDGSFAHTVNFTPDAGANYTRTIARQTETGTVLATDFASGGDNALTFDLAEGSSLYEIVSLNPSDVESSPTSLGSLSGPSGP